MTGHTLLAAVLGSAFLTLFFRSVRLRWPENYSTLRGVIESYVSQGVWRYVAFRSLPVYAVAVFVDVTCRRVHAHPGEAVGLLGILHIASTNGRATVQLFRRGPTAENKANVLVFYAASSVLVAGACVAAAISGSRLGSVVPDPAQLSTAAWTGLFAAVLAVSLQSLGRRDVSDDTLLARGRAGVGERLWGLIADAAARHHTDPALLQAIVAVEVLQRPRSLRRMERVKGRFFPAGSYGVAQVQADAPISDEESIARLAASFDGYRPERNEYGSIHSERLAARLEVHNRKRAFVSMASTFYEALIPSWSGTTAVSLDQRPVIEVAPVVRAGRSWVLAGTASVYEGRVCWIASGDGYHDAGVLHIHQDAPARGAFTLTVPLEARTVTFTEPPMDEDGGDSADRSYTVTL